jgi:hypothetical protein
MAVRVPRRDSRVTGFRVKNSIGAALRGSSTATPRCDIISLSRMKQASNEEAPAGLTEAARSALRRSQMPTLMRPV